MENLFDFLYAVIKICIAEIKLERQVYLNFIFFFITTMHDSMCHALIEAKSKMPDD